LGKTLGFALRLTEENKAEVTEKEEKERMRKNQIGTLFIVSALALSGVGMSYAMWYEEIVISGNVYTGSLDFRWSIVDTDDTEIPEKDETSWITATLSDDFNTMTVLIEHAYPCITYSLWFDIDCVGTVPVHFNDFVFDATAEAWIAAGILTFGADPNYPNQLPITEAQLHTGDHWYGLLTFHFDNDDGFAQDTTYEFDVSLFGYQYNECYEQPAPKLVLLPDGVINFKAWLTNYPPDEYSCIARLYNLPPGEYNVVNMDLYTMWCFEEGPIIYVGTYEGNAPQYSAVLYSSYDAGLPDEFQDEDWDLVNWIINHKGDYPTATAQDFQEAIWYYKDGGATPTNPIGQQIIADAAMYGENFIPEAGQLCAVILDVTDPNVQDVFIEVDP
jgi:hypothetical protein